MEFLDSLIEVTTISTIGNIASVLGLVITVAGFWIAIRGIQKTKQAAQHAREAVEEVRKDMHQFTSISELATAISSMEEIKRLHRQEAWNILPDRYSALRKSLISIRTAYPDLTDSQKATLQGAISQFTTIEKQVETALATDKPLKVARLNSLVTKEVDSLVELLEEIRSHIGG